MVDPQPASIPAKKKSWPIALPVGIVLLLVGAVGAFLIHGTVGDDEGGEVFTQAAGEIFLEPAAEVGPEPFATTAFAPKPPTVYTQQDASSSSSSGSVPSQSGRKEGLYGGTLDNSLCDAAKMSSFLAANTAKAAAWVSALNKDPDVVAQHGSPLTAADIPTYVASLTPMILNTDTRVTNNGFRNGKPTPRQTVLQKGSAVLVDLNGIPRARCYCGNPLTAPVPSPVAPKYTGGTAGWTTPVNLQVVTAPPTPGSGPFTVTPPGQPNGPLSQIPPGSATVASTPTTTAPGAVPSTTRPAATPTTTAVAKGSPPVLSGGPLEPNPQDDANCMATLSPDHRGYIVRGTYSDPDGDAVQKLLADFGANGLQPATGVTFTGDGSSGTIEYWICGYPGDTYNFFMADQNGQGSPSPITVNIP